MATTPILGLPLIDRNMFADVPRDMNALAEAIDRAVGPLGAIALKSEVNAVKQLLEEHTKDNVKHITQREREAWNKAVLDLEQAFRRIGDLNQLATANKTSLVAAVNEVFTDIDNGLRQVANAVTDKGVPTDPNAGFATIVHNVGLINTGKKFAKGETQITGKRLLISGLPFYPSTVIGTFQNSTSSGRFIYSYEDGLHNIGMIYEFGNAPDFNGNLYPNFSQGGFDLNVAINDLSAKTIKWFAIE